MNETVEVVVRLSEDDYKYLKEFEWAVRDIEKGQGTHKILGAILDGTVLPKGHDALLDAGQLMNYCQNQIDGHKYVDCNVIARFPCVIKADKEVE